MNARRLLKIIFLVCLLTSCNSVFFHPVKEQIVDPDKLGIKYKSVTIDDGEGPKLHAWLLPSEGAVNYGTILFLHGNAENISTHIGSVYWLPKYGFTVLALDYRGYGASEGEPTFEGVHRDAKRAAKYLKRLSGAGSPYYLFGQSLGAAIALRIAASSEFRGYFHKVIAESPFASYREIVRDKLSEFWLTTLLKYPLSWTISGKYDPIDTIEKISPTPLLLIHPEGDRTVPLKHSEKLYAKAAEPKQLWKIAEGDHISAFSSESNRMRLVHYLLGSD